jgi:hypothetical protein
MKTSTPYYLRESEYHREKRTEKYWGYAIYTMATFVALWFIIIPLIKHFV